MSNQPQLETLEQRVLLSAYVDVGEHELLPDTPGQQIEIYVTGDTEAQGLNLNAQIADGGTQLGGEVDGPGISIVNILDGTIFAVNNTGTKDLDGAHQDIALQWEGRGTTTVSGTVTSNGLLATVTIDTTGYTGGTWVLSLADTLNGPTDFAGVPIKIIDGSISIAERGRPLAMTSNQRRSHARSRQDHIHSRRPVKRDRPARSLSVGLRPASDPLPQHQGPAAHDAAG